MAWAILWLLCQCQEEKFANVHISKHWDFSFFFSASDRKISLPKMSRIQRCWGHVALNMCSIFSQILRAFKAPMQSLSPGLGDWVIIRDSETIWQFGRAGRVPMDGWQFSPFHHVYYSLETQCMIDRLSLLGAWAGGEAVCDCAVVPGSQAHHTCRLFKDCQVPICFVPKKKYQFVFLERKTYCTSFREDRNIALTSKK